jgi:hypothetical protein
VVKKVLTRALSFFLPANTSRRELIEIHVESYQYDNLDTVRAQLIFVIP